MMMTNPIQSSSCLLRILFKLHLYISFPYSHPSGCPSHPGGKSSAPQRASSSRGPRLRPRKAPASDVLCGRSDGGQQPIWTRTSLHGLDSKKHFGHSIKPLNAYNSDVFYLFWFDKLKKTLQNKSPLPWDSSWWVTSSIQTFSQLGWPFQGHREGFQHPALCSTLSTSLQSPAGGRSDLKEAW